jgi:hypothetical protein
MLCRYVPPDLAQFKNSIMEFSSQPQGTKNLKNLVDTVYRLNNFNLAKRAMGKF